jgi:hypothetical protein
VHTVYTQYQRRNLQPLCFRIRLSSPCLSFHVVFRALFTANKTSVTFGCFSMVVFPWMSSRYRRFKSHPKPQHFTTFSNQCKGKIKEIKEQNNPPQFGLNSVWTGPCFQSGAFLLLTNRCVLLQLKWFPASWTEASSLIAWLHHVADLDRIWTALFYANEYSTKNPTSRTPASVGPATRCSKEFTKTLSITFEHAQTAFVGK